MNKTVFISTVIAAMLLVGTYVSRAAIVSAPVLSQVTPGDTFSMRVSGYSSDQTSSIYLTPIVTATFGQTQTFAGSGPTAGQTITVSSSETVTASTVTDIFSISVPTNFAPAGTTTNGTTPVGVMFAFLGEYDAGTNVVNFSQGIGTPTYSGTFTYSGGTASATQNPTLGTGNKTYASYEGLNAGGADLAQFAIRGFSFTISYPNAVPEPSTYAFSVLALVSGSLWFVRRRQAV